MSCNERSVNLKIREIVRIQIRWYLAIWDDILYVEPRVHDTTRKR